jgi:hypothetical protein
MSRRNTAAFATSIETLLRAWELYAEAHLATYGTPIGSDYVLGAEWVAMGNALLGLLNGELGRLDGGTIDTKVRDIFEKHGFTRDGEVPTG